MIGAPAVASSEQDRAYNQPYRRVVHQTIARAMRISRLCCPESAAGRLEKCHSRILQDP
jgi:hypothetical protein